MMVVVLGRTFTGSYQEICQVRIHIKDSYAKIEAHHTNCVGCRDDGAEQRLGGGGL
jgi:hypothetical protein